MDGINYECPHCGKHLHVPEAYIGRSGKCKRCKQSFVAKRAELAERVTEPPPVPEYARKPSPPPIPEHTQTAERRADPKDRPTWGEGELPPMPIEVQTWEDRRFPNVLLAVVAVILVIAAATYWRFQFGSRDSNDDRMAEMREEMVLRSKAQSTVAAARNAQTLRWQRVEGFAGTRNFDSELVTITADQWKISWKADPNIRVGGVPFIGSFALDLYTAEGEHADQLASVLGPSDGVATFEGSGTFMCTVRSTGSWTVSVEALDDQ